MYTTASVEIKLIDKIIFTTDLAIGQFKVKVTSQPKLVHWVKVVIFLYFFFFFLN